MGYPLNNPLPCGEWEFARFMAKLTEGDWIIQHILLDLPDTTVNRFPWINRRFV